MRVVFAGTPDFAVPTLEALIGSAHEVVACYTQPDRPAGRGRKAQPGPVKRVAVESGVPVCQPSSLRDSAAQNELAAFEADVMVVVAYGGPVPNCWSTHCRLWWRVSSDRRRRRIRSVATPISWTSPRRRSTGGVALSRSLDRFAPSIPGRWLSVARTGGLFGFGTHALRLQRGLQMVRHPAHRCPA